MLNYSALNESITKQDILDYRAVYKKPAGKVARVFGGLGIAAGVLIFGFSFMALLVGDSDARLGALAFLIIGGGITLLIWASTRGAMLRSVKLYKFAKQNNAHFTPLVVERLEVGMIFDQGHTRRTDSIVEFTNGIRVANYQYDTGSGKSQQTHYWTYIRLTLDRHLPHIVLDAKKNNVFGRMTNLPIGFKRGQVEKVHPELDKLYALYVPEDYKQDAYYIFTPDVIAALVDSKGELDIEIVDKYIYFYAKRRLDYTKQENWDRVMSLSATVGKELREQTDYYADSIVGNRAADTIAPQGRRLKPGVTAATIITIIMFVVYMIFTLLPYFN